jgi:hypothetical protein
MKLRIYGATLLLGLAIGTVLVHLANAPSSQEKEAEAQRKAANEKTERAPDALRVRIERLILGQSSAMNPGMPLNEATDVLFAERRSPMRTRAFLKSRIQMMTLNQLVQAMTNGEVQTQEELEEVARRMTQEDPEGTFNHWDAQDFRIKGMESFYTFLNAMLQTWADRDAVAVMKRLQKMPRGGSQQDDSLHFSDYWAKIDPAAAASHFNDVIYLRNMQGNMAFTDNDYAERLVNSWREKDEAGMRDYLGKLPPGREREALDRAVRKLIDMPRR